MGLAGSLLLLQRPPLGLADPGGVYLQGEEKEAVLAAIRKAATKAKVCQLPRACSHALGPMQNVC